MKGRASGVAAMLWCVLAGCLKPAVVECADGSVCPATHRCDAVRGCISPDQLAMCGDQVVDYELGEECDAGPDNSQRPDARCRETCVLPRCGDAVVDPRLDEVCDDGNLESGDGCRPNCFSERCGDGVVDVEVGEACDDGNTHGADGCDPSCRIADVLRWRRVPALPAPASPAWVADLAAGELVMAGGLLSSPAPAAADTWVLRGDAWEPRDGSGLPPLEGATAAYDGFREQVVLFGGVHQETFVASGATHGWDGVRWRSLATAGPSPRFGASMAYDPVRRRIVLFGGGRGSALLDDTWEWDGEAWAEVSGAGSGPTARAGSVLVYDFVQRRVVLFGGEGPGSAQLTDSWAWDGATWVPLGADGPAATPPGAWLSSARQILVQGGLQISDLSLIDATWLGDGATWAAGPAGRAQFGHALASDPWRGRVVSTAGRTGALGATVDSPTSAFTSEGGWRDLPASVAAPFVQDAATASDTRRGRVVMLGGSLAGTLERRGWVWDGRWSEWAGPVPPPHAGPSLAYDAGRDELVYFGNATWRWSESGGWAAVAVSEPPPRRGAAMAYDAANGVIVLTGGVDQLGLHLSDTWRWDGVAWMEVPGASPSARLAAAVAYDARRRRVVLFGGFGPGGALGDTWEWDGQTWTERQPALAPTPRGGARMVYDADRGRIVLWGGAGDRELWEWSGEAWAMLSAQGPPAAAQGHVLAADPVRQQHLLLAMGQTYVLRWEGSGRREVCGPGRPDRDGDGQAGCDDDDCWARCTPSCPPGVSCAAPGPRCGDGACGPLEDCALCPGDCGACAPQCGDLRCEGDEATSCPGDC